MALLGPMVVVAEKRATETVEMLGAGAFPIIEAKWADAAAAIDQIQPCALLLADPEPPPDPSLVQAVAARTAAAQPVLPVLARLHKDAALPLRDALAVSIDEPMSRLLDRLRAALRIRALHAKVLRRAQANEVAAVALPDSLDDATVICFARGGSFPMLAVATGQRVGLIGALSVETAARYLKSRNVEGVVIGEGFGPRAVDGLLKMLADEARFRDLPVGVLGSGRAGDGRLPNLIYVESNPERLIERLIPFVRLQVFESHLNRLLSSLESNGMLDPATGLLAAKAFWCDLDRAVWAARESGSYLSLARFSFEDVGDRRAYLDAARVFSRQVRSIDFACQEQDGSILAAFTETDLRRAHVLARRIAGVLKHTMLLPDDRPMIGPTVTLATLKADDSVSTLLARVGTYPKVAAG